MLSAVNLDDKTGRWTGKINNIWTDGLLSFEFHPKKAMGAQVIPQPFLDLGHGFAQRFGAHKRNFSVWAHILALRALSPGPSPTKRERGVQLSRAV